MCFKVVKENKKTLACVAMAIMLSCLFYYIPCLKQVPSGFSIIICAVLASGVFAIVAPIEVEEETDDE